MPIFTWKFNWYYANEYNTMNRITISIFILGESGNNIALRMRTTCAYSWQWEVGPRQISSDGKYRFFFVSIYIDILTKNIDNIAMYQFFSHNKKSRCHQFFLVFGRCYVNLPALPPPIFTSVVFSISGTEVQGSDIWTSDVRCGDGDMRATSAVNRMARWWGDGTREVRSDRQI